MHVHTSEGSPCAQVDAESMVQAYQKAGYDAIVVTNHYDHELLKGFGETDSEQIERYLLGYRKAKAVEEKYGIQVMLGIEIGLVPNAEEYLIYGIDEAFLFQYPGLCFRKQEEIYKLCHSYGAAFFQAHPFREPCRPQNPAFMDGVEYNQRPNSGNHNEKLTIWLQGHPDLKQISGSDSHTLGQVGFGGIEISQPVHDVKELAAIITCTQVKLIQNGP